MNNIINIANGQPSSLGSNADLIEQLEELLSRAKAGHITAMAMAFVNVDGSVSTRWSGGDQSIHMLAAVTLLQHEFASAIGSGA